MGGYAPIDIVVSAVLAIALLRGLFRGLIREVFSVAAIGGAIVSTKIFARPLAAWLEGFTGGDLAGTSAVLAAGASLVIASVVVVVLVGRTLRKGARWSGLGWADRAGGAVLGAAEGALVGAILIASAVSFLGRDHPALAHTRSLAALERLQRIAQEGEIEELPEFDRGPDVAAPPPREPSKL